MIVTPNLKQFDNNMIKLSTKKAQTRSLVRGNPSCKHASIISITFSVLKSLVTKPNLNNQIVWIQAHLTQEDLLYIIQI